MSIWKSGSEICAIAKFAEFFHPHGPKSVQFSIRKEMTISTQGHRLWPSLRSLLNDFRMAMDELLASPEQVDFMADFFSFFSMYFKISPIFEV